MFCCLRSLHYPFFLRFLFSCFGGRDPEFRFFMFSIFSTFCRFRGSKSWIIVFPCRHPEIHPGWVLNLHTGVCVCVIVGVCGRCADIMSELSQAICENCTSVVSRPTQIPNLDVNYPRRSPEVLFGDVQLGVLCSRVAPLRHTTKHCTTLQLRWTLCCSGSDCDLFVRLVDVGFCSFICTVPSCLGNVHEFPNGVVGGPSPTPP